MIKIEAFIRPFILEEIKDALKTINIKGMTISQVMGCGNQMGWTEVVRGSEVDYNFRPKIKLELFVRDEQVEEVVETIRRVAYTGEVGDGKIFISEVRDALRIRTGERGDAALQ